MIASDVYLNLKVYNLPLTLDQYVMFAWYAAPCFIGVLLRNRVKPLNVLGAGLGTGIGFFLASNFAVWAFGNIAYAHNLSGLLLCYTKAFRFSATGLFLTCVFRGAVQCPGADCLHRARDRGQERGSIELFLTLTADLGRDTLSRAPESPAM